MEKALHILTIVSFSLFLAVWAQQALVQTWMLFRRRATILDMNARRAEIVVFFMAAASGAGVLGLFWIAAARGLDFSATMAPAVAGVTLVTFMSWTVMRRHRHSVSLFNIRPRDFQYEAQGFFDARGIKPRIDRGHMLFAGGATLKAALFTAAHSVRLDPEHGASTLETRVLARDLAEHVACRAPKRTSLIHLLLVGKMYVMAGLSLAFLAAAFREFETSLL